MSSPPPKNALPFEPRKKKKNRPPKVQKTVTTPKESNSPSLRAIPEEVSRRMVRRMALFSGIPTLLGMSSFVIAYLIVSQGWFELPTYVVLAVSLGLFGLGVLGLSYGIFSTSWDEDRAGSWWGWQEFKVNLSRTLVAWRNERQKAKES